MEPVNLELSVPPKVSSPLFATSDVVGSNETPISSVGIVPWLARLSVTVGIVEKSDGNKVPSARQIAHRTMENKRIAAQGGNPTLAITADGEDADKEIKTNLDARPAKPDAWNAKPENSLMFLPSSV